MSPPSCAPPPISPHPQLSELLWKPQAGVSVQLGVLNRQYLEQEIGGSGYITLSLLGGACQMSMVELSKMRVPDFAKLWTVSLPSLAQIDFATALKP